MHNAPTIRALAAHEMDLPMGWAAAEGWNPGRHDAAAFHAADPEGFLVAELAGRPVGVISAVRAGAGFGFVGLYIVAPEYRGNGYGMALWRAAMARLEGRTAGLDGVVAQQANYARSGFVLAHRNIRHGGVVAAERAGDCARRPAWISRRWWITTRGTSVARGRSSCARGW